MEAWTHSVTVSVSVSHVTWYLVETLQLGSGGRAGKGDVQQKVHQVAGSVLELTLLAEAGPTAGCLLP